MSRPLPPYLYSLNSAILELQKADFLPNKTLKPGVFPGFFPGLFAHRLELERVAEDSPGAA